jgi:hypothetical protein
MAMPKAVAALGKFLMYGGWLAIAVLVLVCMFVFGGK